MARNRSATPGNKARAGKTAASSARKPMRPPATTPASHDIRTIFFTGFPGFIGTRLVAKILRDEPDSRVIALVQAKFIDAARKAVDGLLGGSPEAAARITLAVGDLTLKELGLDPEILVRLRREATEVWHLAAVYDLAVPELIATRVNVEGTRNVLDLCESLRKLEQLVYFSTCYVSGTRSGFILESELEMGQSFKNHYESTKFKAEILVRQRSSVPAVVIRPSIVVGDSRTGETDKFDGPYPIFRLLAQAESRGWLRKGWRIPTLGSGDAHVNLVPVDYLVEASYGVARSKGCAGRTFQICDPAPLKAREIFARAYALFGLGEPWGAVPNPVLRTAARIPVLSDVLAIDKRAVDYIDHFVEYDGANTQKALSDVGLVCPEIREYLPTIIQYVRDHVRFRGRAKY